MNKIESYIDSVIPKNIPKSKQQKLKSEIESHIYDRIDFYTDIGYDTDSSINKALTDMGEDEETKTSIRNDFEEIHYESKWWAVVTGILMLILNFVSIFVEIGLFLDFGSPSDIENSYSDFRLVYSFSVLFLVLISALAFYKKGFRKCLIALGVSNLLTLNGAYAIGSVYSVCSVLTYFAVKNSNIPLSQSYLVLSSVVFAVWIFLIIGISVACFLLSVKVRKNGRPQKRYVGTALFCMFYLVIAVVSIHFYVPAQRYFAYNPDWFSPTQDMYTEQSENIYNQLFKNTTLKQTEKIMEENGYCTFDEYEKTLDKDSVKKFRYNIETLDFFFEDDYEIWFDPEIEADDCTNRFVYILRDENGKIKSKGVGNAFEDVRTYSIVEKYDVIADCVDTFLSYEGGESEKAVLDYFGKDCGTVYGKFTTYTENGENNYYRICCSGLDKSGQWKPGINSMYIELWFENGILSKGNLHYSEMYYDEKIQETAYRNDYYTLAD